MIWDIPVCSTLTRRTVAWRGNGNGAPASSQYAPKMFALSAGPHQLIIRGREGNVTLGAITIIAAPPQLQIQPAPGGAIVLSGTGQPGQAYSVLRSQDLGNWAVIGAVTIDNRGFFEFWDDTAMSRPSSTYRLQRVAAVPPRLEISAGAGSPVLLSGTGQPGDMFDVLASQDFRSWTTIGSVLIDASGSFQFVDPLSGQLPSRSYRLQEQ